MFFVGCCNLNTRLTKLQYTYYTVSALGYRVPNIVKRTLTTMQIMQFVLGSTFAALHLFVSYTVPVSIAHQITEQVSSKISPSSVASAVSSVTASATSALPAATGPALAFLKKLVYRAAGDEGLAENIGVPGSPLAVAPGHVPTGHAGHVEHPVQHLFHHKTVNKVVYRTEYQHVQCIDTSGQAFAVYLNLIYLAPLTGLFMRFFVKSYLRRTNPKGKHQTKHDAIVKAGRDASHGVERELESLGKAAEDTMATGIDKSKDALRGRKSVNGNTNPRSSLSPADQDFVKNVSRKVSQRLQELNEGAEATSEKAKEIARDVASKAEEAKSKVQERAQATNDALEEKAQQNADEVNQAQESAPSTPSKKKRNRNKNKKSDDESKTEPEPEPKDINNTLSKSEGKGMF
jgi:hypothetical protein